MAYEKWFSVECPRCGKTVTCYPALSRRDNETYICDECGEAEARFDYVIAGRERAGLMDIPLPGFGIKVSIGEAKKMESAWLRRTTVK